MSGTSNLLGRFLSLASAKVVTTVLAVLSTPIIVRLLGPTGYGDYAVVLSVFSLYMIPISAMVTEGVQKFVGEGRDEEGWAEGVIGFYAVVAVVVLFLGALILLTATLSGLPSRFFGSGFDRYFLLLVALVVASQFRALGSHTVLGLGLEHVDGPLSIVNKLGTVSLGILLVVGGYGVTGMLAGHVAANVLVAVLAGGVVVRRLSIRRVFDPPSIPYRRLLSFNVVNVGLVFLSMSLYHVDVIMLRALTDGETTGFYKAALAIAEYLWFVPIVVQRLLLHSTSDLWADDRIEAVTSLAGRVTRQIFLFVVLLSVGLAPMADRVMGLYYGSQYVVATAPLLILLPGTIAFSAARPLKAIAQGSGRLRALGVAMGAAAALNVALNALLIPQYGMTGAAVATSVGYASMFAFTVVAAYRIGFDPLSDLRPGRIAVTAGITAVPVVGLDRVLGPDILAFAIIPPVGGAVFFVAAVATGALDREELTSILDRLPDRVRDAIASAADRVDR